MIGGGGGFLKLFVQDSIPEAGVAYISSSSAASSVLA